MQASGVALGGPALIPSCIAHVESGPICHEALMIATARGCDLQHTKDLDMGKKWGREGGQPRVWNVPTRADHNSTN